MLNCLNLKVLSLQYVPLDVPLICIVCFPGLCFIQPFMALLRPKPDGKYRPVFNVLHLLVGTSAHGVGLAAIFLAVELDKAELPSETTYLLIAFAIFHGVVHAILSITSWATECRPNDDRAGHHQVSNGRSAGGGNGAYNGSMNNSLSRSADGHYAGGGGGGIYGGHHGLAHNNGYYHNGYYKTHSSSGYPMRQYYGSSGSANVPPEPYPDYEELVGRSSGNGRVGRGDNRCSSCVKHFFLVTYIVGAALVAAALIALVVMAPAEQLLRDAGVIP